MDRGAWHATVPGVTKSWTWLKQLSTVVQCLSCIWLFVTPWTAACQAPLSFTISWSLLRFMSIEWVMLSNHLILCCPLLLLPSVFPSIKVFSIHTHVWASLVAQTVKNLPAMQETQVWFLSQEDPLEKGIDNPLQYSCLENSMDRGVWWTTVHGAAENWTWLSD